MRRGFAIFVVAIQSFLFLAHFFLYRTWIDFWRPPDPMGVSNLQLALGLLSITFIAASILAFRYFNLIVRCFYKIAAVWLGFFSFFFYAAFACWIALAISGLFGLAWSRRAIAAVCFALALAAGLYGIANACWTRTTQITVKLPNLPPAWRGRTAALVSDLHLGHVRNYRFVRRVVRMLARLQPDVVLIAGDMYDGTNADLDGFAEPWKELLPPFGKYFVAGNHEEFTDHTKYLDAVRRAGIRVLDNEKTDVDGLQVIGVHYRDSSLAPRFRSILEKAQIDRKAASVLLTHAPHLLDTAEQAGISLQLSRHTHGGQFAPYTWSTRRIYGKYIYGLQRLGNMTTYTSYGVGTWGPPMRVGTRPEIALIRFE